MQLYEPHTNRQSFTHESTENVAQLNMINSDFAVLLQHSIRETLFSIQLFFQRCTDVNCDVFACFMKFKTDFAFVLVQRRQYPRQHNAHPKYVHK